MGTIYKRGKTYWIKFYQNGKPIFESSKSRKEADARKLLKRKEGAIAEGRLPGIYFDKVMLGELADDFLIDYRVNKKKSLAKAERSVRHLKQFFGSVRAVDITTAKVKEYIRKRMDEEMKNSSINRELAALKRIFNLGKQCTPPKVNTVPYIPLLEERNVRKGFLEHWEFLALRAALPDYLKGFCTFGYKVGWRSSEIAEQTWSQVDLHHGIVRLEVGETKNDEGRTVYLDEELKSLFREQWNIRKKKRKLLPYVFLNSEGNDRIKRFDKSWKSACEKAGLGNRLFHDLRRTAVRNMVRAGIPERVAMMVSGHKTRSVFDRYNIVSDADLRQAAEKQEAYLKSQMVTKMVTIVPFNEKRNYDGGHNPLIQLNISNAPDTI